MRLLKRRRGLEADIDKLKASVSTVEAAEKAKWERHIVDLQSQLLEERKLLEETRGLLEKSKDKERETGELVVVQRSVIADVEQKLTAARDKLGNTEQIVAGLQEENLGLKNALAAVPSQASVVAEFKLTEEYKKEIIAARVAGVAAYKISEDFGEAMEEVATRAVNEFKAGSQYTAELEEAKTVAVTEYSKSVSFRRAVGVEAGKMSKQVVECCRVFLKDNMQRPTSEFGEFFMSYLQQRRGSEIVGSCSAGSAEKSST